MIDFASIFAPPKGGKHYVYLCVFVVNVLVFGGALNLTWTSPVFPKLSAEDDADSPFNAPTNDEENSWIGSLLTLGAVCGPFLWGYLADAIGRKPTLLLLSVPFTIGYAALAFATAIEIYYVARFVAGLSLGGLFIIVPMYVVEVCDVKVRGALSSAQNLSVCGSTIFAYAIGPRLNVTLFSIVCLTFTVVFVPLAWWLLRESPYYLIKKNHYNAAERALKAYHGTRVDQSTIDEELRAINATINETISVTFAEIFRSRFAVKGLTISLALMLFQQCSGINVILFNTQTIFTEAKSSVPADLASILVGVASFVCAVVSTVLVDRLGRKLLFVVSGVGMFVSELALGVYFYLLKNAEPDVSESVSWLPIASLLAYIGFYNVAFGPLPWTILAEVLPANVKNKLSPIVSSFSWLLAFVMTKFYPAIVDGLELYGAFWLFTGFNAIAIVFCVVVLPETKGKSLQEIEIILSK